MGKTFYGNSLAKRFLSGNFSHAYLVLGEVGIGKRTFALELATAILCTSPIPPCHSCNSCNKIEKSAHPDLKRISGNGKAKSIHIDDIRAFRADAHILPNDGEKKVYIIEDAEQMTIQSANALLKVLEEPPSSAVFILTASDSDALPETIISRCICITLGPVPKQDLLTALSELCKETDSAKLNLAADFGAGNIAKSLAFLSDDNSEQSEDIAQKIAVAICGRSEYELLQSLHLADRDKVFLAKTLGVLLDTLRLSLIAKSTNSHTNEVLSKFSDKFSTSQIISIIEIVTTSLQDINKNANTALLLTYMSSAIKSV